MRLLKVAKYLTDGDEIRLSFWPKGMHFKIGRENEKASLLYRYYNGSNKGSLKMAFKSILNIFSDKWEVKPPEFDKDGNKIKYYKYNEKVEDKTTKNVGEIKVGKIHKSKK